MTLPILEQAVEAVPDVSFRLRDFLASRVSRPIPEPGPAAAIGAAPAPGAEAPAAAEAEAPADSEALETGTAIPGPGPSSERDAPRADEQPPLEPYALKSISVPPKGETAEADAEAGHGL